MPNVPPPNLPKNKPGPGATFVNENPSFNPTLAYNGQIHANAGEDERRMHGLLEQLHENMTLAGYVGCTIVNMQPFPLVVNGVLHDDIVIPPCPPDHPEGMIRYFLGEYKVSTSDKGDGNYIPVAEPPVKLGSDFEREFNEMGGVFFLPGDIDPTDPKNDNVQVRRPEGRQMIVRTVKEIKDAAFKRMIAFAKKKVKEADREWNKPNGQKHIISDWHKNAAMVLHRYEGNAIPVWVTMTKSEANVEDCPGCHGQVKKGVPLCKECGYVFDPMKAYDLRLIGRDNLQLERLTKEELEEIGLDPDDYEYKGKPRRKKAAVAAAPASRARPQTAGRKTKPVEEAAAANDDDDDAAGAGGDEGGSAT